MDQMMRLDVLKKAPITNAAWNELRKVGTPTGSFIFGGYQEGESDIDFLLPPDSNFTLDKLFRYLVYGADYDDLTGFQSFYIHNKDNDVLNILSFTSEEMYRTWKQATKWMRVLTKVKVIQKICKNKKHRVLLFETLKTVAQDKIQIPPKWKPKQYDLYEDVPF